MPIKRIISYLSIGCVAMLMLAGVIFAEDTANIIRGVNIKNGPVFSIKFANSDLKDTLRFLGKIANINIIVPEDINGVVSSSFGEATIEDAINSIVKSNGLDYAVENGIWRVGQGEAFASSGEDLKSETLRLKYASAKDLGDKVKEMLSSRGSVIADGRTNSLIIKERPAIIENVRTFLAAIDIRDAQVLIEARIVEANRDFSRSLGVQWGVTSTGTRVNAQGVTAVGTDDAGRALMQNLPSPSTPGSAGPTSGLGLIIGQLAGGTTLDFQLTAAEQKGDLTIISEPTIVTSNGVLATIRSGETIYIKTTGDITIGATGGSSTTGGSSGLQQVQTGIELNVTPQISVEGYIKLDIGTKTSQLDFSRTVDGIPVIIDSNASTSVVVQDGETTVIGGLTKLTGSVSNRSVPGLSKIPLLGNLFKSKGRYKQNKDLIIFIRPIIVKTLADIPQNARYGKVEEMREEILLADDKKKPPYVRKPGKKINKYSR